MRLGIAVAIASALVGCGRANPRFMAGGGAGTGAGSTGRESVDASDGRPATGSRTTGDGEASLSGVDATGTTRGVTEGGVVDGDSSSESADEGMPAQPPCEGVRAMPELIACWDFDEITADGRVLDRSGNDHDLLLPADAATTPGFWGDALDPSVLTFAEAELGEEGPVRVEVWFHATGESFGAPGMNLTLLDAIASPAAQLFFTLEPEPTVTVEAGVAVGGTVLPAPVDACVGFDLEAGVLVVRGSWTEDADLAPPPDPVLRPPTLLLLDASFAGFIDGIRVWSGDGGNLCTPFPPP